MTEQQLKQKHKFLSENIFFGLNKFPEVGAASIIYFNESDFEIVLNRVKAHGVGIYGIEVTLNGEYYTVMTFEEFSSYPQDSNWYTAAFNKLKALKLDLKYSASYYIGGNYMSMV